MIGQRSASILAIWQLNIHILVPRRITLHDPHDGTAQCTFLFPPSLGEMAFKFQSLLALHLLRNTVATTTARLRGARYVRPLLLFSYLLMITRSTHQFSTHKGTPSRHQEEGSSFTSVPPKGNPLPVHHRFGTGGRQTLFTPVVANHDSYVRQPYPCPHQPLTPQNPHRRGVCCNKSCTLIPSSKRFSIFHTKLLMDAWPISFDNITCLPPELFAHRHRYQNN